VKLRVVLSLMLAGLAAGAWAQRAPQPPELQSGPPPSTGPMELDVVVTDKAGHPLPGLQQSDFTLSDNKQPTQIVSFHAFDSTTPPSEPTQVLIVVDEINTAFVAVSTERTQLHNLFTQNGGHLPYPTTLIFLTDQGLQQVNQPSSDGNEIDNLLRQQQGTLREIPRSAGFYGGADRMQISLQRLGALGMSAGKSPGRKLILWISQGWWLFDSPNVYPTEKDRKSYFSAIVGLSTILRDSRATLYAVDPLGTADAGAIRNVEWESFLKPVRASKNADPGDLALQVTATHTGGLVLYGSNDVASELSKCIADASAWYEITFNPQRADAPDTWHDIEVKVDKPGLKIRTSNGYYAGP
jgi:VWFA-related protein